MSDKPVIPIPVVSAEQHVEDVNLNYMEMPTSMSTFQYPDIEENLATEASPEVFSVLGNVVEALENVEETACYDIQQLPLSDINFINQLLGEGEVSATIRMDDGSVRVQESTLAGLWRVQVVDNDQNLVSDTLEVAAIPVMIKSATFSNAEVPMLTEMSEQPGLMNAPSVLIEVQEKAEKYLRDRVNDEINLSLLPFSPEDQTLLIQQLGQGPTVMLSRGYGNCRIDSTVWPYVWWLRYYNSQDKIIMERLFIGEVPEAALAAPEDLKDSAMRLREILEIYT
jgi:hydrogenase-1 operon protein HyaF